MICYNSSKNLFGGGGHDDKYKRNDFDACQMVRLTSKQILALHGQLIAERGGRDGVRDEALMQCLFLLP